MFRWSFGGETIAHFILDVFRYNTPNVDFVWDFNTFLNMFRSEHVLYELTF